MIGKTEKKLLYEMLSKSLPESAISEYQIERARWRWIFLRLNEDYRKKCMALKVDTFLILPQHNEFGTQWINPDLSFDKILKIVSKDLDGVEVDDKEKAIRVFVLLAFGMLLHPAVGIVGERDNTIGLQIDLDTPDSQILKEVAEILKTHRKPKSKKRPFKRLKEFYQAYALYSKYGSIADVARIMFPEPEYDQAPEDESGIDANEDAAMKEADRCIINPESAEKKVARYLEEAGNLIEGGYRNI